MWMGQQGYTKAVLKKFGMEHCKPANMPIARGVGMGRARGAMAPHEN